MTLNMLGVFDVAQHIKDEALFNLMQQLRRDALNDTELVIPDCPWHQYPHAYNTGHGVGVYCADILDYVNGWREVWQGVAWMTVVMQLIMLVWTIHDLYRLARSYRQGLIARFFSNPLFISQIVSMLGSMLMALAYIDPWALQGWYNTDVYLGLYAAPYGLIGAHVCIIAIYIFDLMVWKAMKRSPIRSSGLMIFSWVGVSLIVVYAGIGYPIFGWILAAAFKKDNSTPLGLVGNYLAYTMYGLIMFVSLVVGVGANIALARHQSTRRDEKDKEKIILTRGRITSWCTINFLACAFFLGFQMNYQWRAEDSSLWATFILLGPNRFLEILLQANTNMFSDAQFTQPFYCHTFFSSEKIRERGDATSKTSRMSRVGSTLATSPSNSKHSRNNTGSTDDTDHGSAKSPRSLGDSQV